MACSGNGSAKEQAEQSRRQQEAAELSRQQAILDRRAREAIAPNHHLYWFTAGEMLRQVCPTLTAGSFRESVFTENFHFRRFRFIGRIATFSRTTGEGVLVGEICGNLRAVVLVNLTQDVELEFQRSQGAVDDATFKSLQELIDRFRIGNTSWYTQHEVAEFRQAMQQHNPRIWNVFRAQASEAAPSLDPD